MINFIISSKKKAYKRVKFKRNTILETLSELTGHIGRKDVRTDNVILKGPFAL